MADVRETGLTVFRELMPNLLPEGDPPRSGFADELLEIGIENVFGRLWGRDGLSRRDRSLVTLGISSRFTPPATQAFPPPRPRTGSRARH